MLYDRHPVLPYLAVVPWPLIDRNGQPDWIESVGSVESWLESRVGPHYVRWCWNMYHLTPDLCGVTFAREQDSVLFLLRWDV